MLVRWQRGGFRCYWRWKLRPAGIQGNAKSLRRTSWGNACLPTSAVSCQNCLEAFRGSCPHGQMIELRVAVMGSPCCTSPAIGNLCKQVAVQARGRRLRPRTAQCIKYLRVSSMSHENLDCGFPPEWCRIPRRGRRRKSPKTHW
jgi:hypothetical protein